MDDDVIQTTGLDLTILDDRKSIVLAFKSLGRAPVRVAMPLAVAARFAGFIQERIAEAGSDGSDPAKLN